MCARNPNRTVRTVRTVRSARTVGRVRSVRRLCSLCNGGAVASVRPVDGGGCASACAWRERGVSVNESLPARAVEAGFALGTLCHKDLLVERIEVLHRCTQLANERLRSTTLHSHTFPHSHS